MQLEDKVLGRGELQGGEAAGEGEVSISMCLEATRQDQLCRDTLEWSQTAV